MIRVIKANGQVEPFSETKLLGSIQRAGVPRSAQLDVLRDIEKTIYDNIPTSTLYAQIIDSLSKNHPHSRGKYSLKQAIMLLGPTGYPFEDFVSKLLAAQGYQTRIRQTLWGKESQAFYSVDNCNKKKRSDRRSILVVNLVKLWIIT